MSGQTLSLATSLQGRLCVGQAGSCCSFAPLAAAAAAAAAAAGLPDVFQCGVLTQVGQVSTEVSSADGTLGRITAGWWGQVMCGPSWLMQQLCCLACCGCCCCCCRSACHPPGRHCGTSSQAGQRCSLVFACFESAAAIAGALGAAKAVSWPAGRCFALRGECPQRDGNTTGRQPSVLGT